MRPFASTISLTEALAILNDATEPISRTEHLGLDRLAGRVLARTLRSESNVPPFDRSAMDGYALRAQDTTGASPLAPASLRVVGRVFTGEASSLAVGPGECFTIATGAPLPPSADAVVMVEQTDTTDGNLVRIHTACAVGQNVSPRGADIAQGETVLVAGTLLTPARVGTIAAMGLTHVDVYARPRVFVASTGNEVVSPGTPLAPGHIYDINRFTLPPLIAAHGGEVVDGATTPDTVEALQTTIDAALGAEADFIVLSGGSSVGDRDLLVDAVRARGDLLFHGIAVKPGKPTLLARVGRSLLFGMPGNPTSCLSNAYVLLVPALRRIGRLPAWQPEKRQARLVADVRNTSGRHTFLAVRIEQDVAVPTFKGSGEITSLAQADGYIEVPADVTLLPAGASISVTMF